VRGKDYEVRRCGADGDAVDEAVIIAVVIEGQVSTPQETEFSLCMAAWIGSTWRPVGNGSRWLLGRGGGGLRRLSEAAITLRAL
jgi:hypothetical protein